MFTLALCVFAAYFVDKELDKRHDKAMKELKAPLLAAQKDTPKTDGAVPLLELEDYVSELMRLREKIECIPDNQKRAYARTFLDLSIFMMTIHKSPTVYSSDTLEKLRQVFYVFFPTSFSLGNIHKTNYQVSKYQLNTVSPANPYWSLEPSVMRDFQLDFFPQSPEFDSKEFELSMRLPYASVLDAHKQDIQNLARIVTMDKTASTELLEDMAVIQAIEEIVSSLFDDLHHAKAERDNSEIKEALSILKTTPASDNSIATQSLKESPFKDSSLEELMNIYTEEHTD